MREIQNQYYNEVHNHLNALNQKTDKVQDVDQLGFSYTADENAKCLTMESNLPVYHEMKHILGIKTTNPSLMYLLQREDNMPTEG